MTQSPATSTSDGDRELGGFERFFWLINHNSPSHFVCAADIAGPTTRTSWMAAADALQARHPLLSACIEGGADAAVRFRPVADAHLPVRMVSLETSSDWMAEVAREMATPFDARTAPLARLTVMLGTDRSVLVFASHHSIGDGIAVAYAIRDLLRALSGETLEQLPGTASAEELLAHCAPASPSDAGAPAAAAAAAAPVVPGVYRNGGSTTPVIDSRRLSIDLTTKLRERARSEGTTVHGALCAAAVVAARTLAGDWSARTVRILSPVDIRELLGVTDDYGLRLSAGLAAMEPAGDASFWELARGVRAGLIGAKTFERTAPLLGAITGVLGGSVDAPAAGQFAAHAFPYEVMVTNLGTLPFATSFGALKLTTLWGPAFLVGYEGEQTIGVATTNGALALLHTSHTPIPSLLATMESVLSAACTS